MLPMIPLPLRLAFLSAACSLIAQPLPGTQPLTWEGDIDVRMMDGAHRFVERRIAESVTTRHRHWRRDATNYDDSIAPNRGRFLKKIGVTVQVGPDSENQKTALPQEFDEATIWRGFQDFAFPGAD